MNSMYLGSVFDGDHESDIIFMKIYREKTKYMTRYRQFMLIYMVMDHLVQFI